MAEVDRNKTVWIIMLVMGLIIGILLALMGPNIAHIFFFQYGENFIVSTPFISNILVGIATIVFCIGCIGMLFDRTIIKIIGSLVLIVSLFMLYSGFTHYTIFSNDEITIREPISKVIYEWDEVESAQLSSVSDEVGNNIEGILRIVLTFNDGNELAVKINTSQESWRYNRLRGILNYHGVNMDYNY